MSKAKQARLRRHGFAVSEKFRRLQSDHTHSLIDNRALQLQCLHVALLAVSTNQLTRAGRQRYQAR